MTRAPDPHRGRHVHGMTGHGDLRYLGASLALITAFLVAEVAVAVTAHSLALLADAGHLLVDVAAIAVSVWAVRLAARPASGRWTFGLKRAEILSATANGVTLLVVAALVSYEAGRRLAHPSAVTGRAMLVVALVGVAVNLVTTWLLRRADRTSMNVEGAFQHVLTDVYAFAATAIAAGVILVTGYRRADPLASLVVVALMLRAAFGLLRDSGQVLLEAAPKNVDLVEVAEHLKRTPHVRGMHDLHVWTVTDSLPALSAHVVVDDSCFTDGHAPQILDALQHCIGGHFDVEHSTFQLEPASHADHEVGHHP